MLRVAVLAVAAILLPVHAALAQTDTTEPSGLVRLNLTSNSLALALEPAAAAQPGRTAMPARGYFIKVFGGVWIGSGEGFLAGGGVGLQPFMNKQHEVGGNVSFLRVEESNGLMFEGNYNYNFTMQQAAFIPFVLAGINIAHFGGSDECEEFEDEFGDFVDVECGSTDAALQLGGGIRRALANGREFFAELIFALYDHSPVIIRGGLAW
jgi:hypothetical protein